MEVSTFPNGMTGNEVLVKLDLMYHEVVSSLFDLGLNFSVYESDYVTGATSFAWMDSEDEIIGDIHLDNRTVQGAKGKMEIEFLKTSVLWGAEQVLSMMKGGQPNENPFKDAPFFKAATLSKEKAEKIKKLGKEIIAKQKAGLTSAEISQQLFTTTNTGDYDMPTFFPNSQLKTAATVKLSEATQMYQPVKGTSSHSRYFVVGISEGIKVAARLKGKSLSIRIEGSDLNNTSFVNAMNAVGISSGSKGVYASMHVDAPDPITATKAVGSVLSALPVQWKTPMPSVGHLQGLGS
jgi:hypothetical protein